MDEVGESPLPLDFYLAAPWQESLLSFYVDSKGYLSREILQDPIDVFTRSLQRVIEVYGNFPQYTYGFLRQCVDPLFEPDEYEKEIYAELRSIAGNVNDPRIADMAECLLGMRKMFQQEKALLEAEFKPSIEMVDKPSYELKFQEFASVLQMIVKVHVQQVASLIKERHMKLDAVPQQQADAQQQAPAQVVQEQVAPGQQAQVLQQQAQQPQQAEAVAGGADVLSGGANDQNLEDIVAKFKASQGG